MEPATDLITRVRDKDNPDQDRLIFSFHRGQEEAWRSERRFIAVLAGAQGGKALCVTTKILTDNGFKSLLSIKSGDMVFSRDGSPCNVVLAHEPYLSSDCYEITFDDGTSVVADGPHKWVCSTKRERHRLFARRNSVNSRSHSKQTEAVRTTEEIHGLIHAGENIAIENCQPIKPNSGENERFSQKRIKESIHSVMSGDAKVPSFDARLRLIRSMMDKNGRIDRNGQCCYHAQTGKEKSIFNFLAYSLGLKTSEWVVGNISRIRFYSYFRIFSEKTEVESQRERSKSHSSGFKSNRRYIRSVEKVGARYVRCLTVDSADSTYLCTESLIPTHNTSFGPIWLYREIYGMGDFKGRGEGDYLAVTATFDLFKMKMLPAILEVFVKHFGVGRYWAGDRLIELKPHRDAEFMARSTNDPMWGRIVLRSAESSGGLESATAKGAWLDEAGQDSFTGETWRSVQSRVALKLGRVLMSTTLYNFDWLKRDVYDEWEKGNEAFDVIHFDSCDNPAFSKQEYDRAKSSMPEWRFDMRYRGRFTRPAGMIYDCFIPKNRPEGHLCDPFPIPWPWPRYVGLDFGGSNTAAVFIAMDPGTKKLYCYRQYLKGELTAEDHVKNIMSGEPDQLVCIGGSPSEGQWRKEFGRVGLFVQRPDVSEVEIGISRVYSAIKTYRIYFFNDLKEIMGIRDEYGGLIGEIKSYARKVDRDGNPTTEIEAKSRYHRLDALRYVMSGIAELGTGHSASFGKNILDRTRRGFVHRNREEN